MDMQNCCDGQSETPTPALRRAKQFGLQRNDTWDMGNSQSCWLILDQVIASLPVVYESMESLLLQSPVVN